MEQENCGRSKLEADPILKLGPVLVRGPYLWDCRCACLVAEKQNVLVVNQSLKGDHQIHITDFNDENIIVSKKSSFTKGVKSDTVMPVY